MRLLILGGTVFLGRHLVEASFERGHEVTLFNRGRSGPDLFPQVESLHGDRDGDIAALDGRSWDAVVDTSGYVTRVVRASAELLAGKVGHYTFVSSISVYRDFSQPGLAEDGKLEALPEESEDVRAHYGALKALCEHVVEEVLPGRALNIRPGLIVGPHDPTERFTYWVRRIARGGRVLAPGSPDRQIQIIDGRDLAEWLVTMVERQEVGTYNATGPDYELTMGAFLESCRTESGSDAELVWVDDDFLLAHDVGQWMELPLWLSGPDSAGLLAVDITKAAEAGLTFRPIAETVRDTLRWALSSERGTGTRAMGSAEGVGLAAERETELFAEWDAR